MQATLSTPAIPLEEMLRPHYGLYIYISTYMPYCSTKLEWCKEEQWPNWGATQPCITLAGTFRCSDTFCFFSSEMTPDFVITSALGCAARRGDHLRDCAVTGLSQGWEFLKLALLRNILWCRAIAWDSYGITAHSFVCLSLGGEKMFLTCVTVGLFPPAVLTDMLGVLLCTPLSVGLPEKLMWVLIEYTQECTHTNHTQQYKIELDVRGTQRADFSPPCGQLNSLLHSSWELCACSDEGWEGGFLAGPLNIATFLIVNHQNKQCSSKWSTVSHCEHKFGF